jgi:hypothetical protein
MNRAGGAGVMVSIRCAQPSGEQGVPRATREGPTVSFLRY